MFFPQEKLLELPVENGKYLGDIKNFYLEGKDGKKSN